MHNFLVFDGINGEYHGCDTIEEARKYIEEIICDPDEGYHPDLESCCIYKLNEKVSYEVVDTKENYKYMYEEDIPEDDNDSESWPYSSNFDEIWKHKFKKC